MGGVLLLLLAPLVMWAITEVLERWASTTYLWVMGEPLLAEHDLGLDVAATLSA